MESSDLSKRVNQFFFSPFVPKQKKKDITNRLDEEYDISEDQAKIFQMRYIEKRPIDFIADTLGYSQSTVKQELATIRAMLDKLNIL